MTTKRDPEALLTAYLLDGMEVLSDRVVDSVLDEVHRTHRRATRSPLGIRPISRAWIAAAAAVAVVVVSGVLYANRRDSPVIVGPSATPTAAATPTEVATPTPTVEVTPPAVQSLELTWTKVAMDEGSPQIAWLGDRFVLVDQDTGAVRTSTDGVTWDALQPGDADPGYVELLRRRPGDADGTVATWEDDIVVWGNPEEGWGSVPDGAPAGRARRVPREVAGKPPVTARDVIRIIRPPAGPVDSSPFKGRIQSIAIGPAGFVAVVASHLDWDAWVTKKLGLSTNNQWVKHLKSVDFRDGILRIELDNGPGLEVNWADEGFLPGDYLYTGFGWYSPDGVAWTPIPGYGTDFTLDQVIGVADGFIAQGAAVEDRCPLPDGCGEMWHSSDGLTWRNLGPSPDGPPDGPMVPWNGGALLTDGVERFEFWTSQGSTELPMATELPTAPKEPQATFATGPLGIVSLSRESHEILFTRNGVDWDINPMPAAMAADQTINRDPSVVVGDRSVLVILLAGNVDHPTRSLWVGTPTP